MGAFDILWLIPILPLIGATVNGVFGKRLSKNVIGTLAAGSVGLSFLISLRAFVAMLALPQTGLPILRDYFTWIQAGTFQAQFGLMLDHLSGLMILIVTGVGFLIHIYSLGYMSHEEGFYRYFSYLNLFVFFMLTLVLANNYLLMFVGWEGVGLCSYLLIGFWFSKKSAADAGKKAFVVNRVGDFGFILAIMLIYRTFERVDFQSVFSRVEDVSLFPVEPLGTVGVLTTICLLLFVGAAGKSAQFPLYVWLPDAMEGPTPVSALIHAATMVTAGVYMVARSAALYNRAPGALFVVAVVGVFHLMTHAFFKALLFLGAGSVIHGMAGIQDIRQMGGLRHHMPWTYRTFLVGTLAIAGIPGLAGFFSKDAVLEAAWSHAAYGKLLWAVGVIAAGFTSFYMFRLLILTFYGAPRYSEHDVHHVHESPSSMVVPLIILAVFSIVAGYIDIPHFLTPASLETEREAVSSSTQILLMAASTTVALLGFGLAYLFYVARPGLPDRLATRAHAMYSILVNKYYVDELYDAIIVWPIVQTSRELLWKVVDTLMIDGAVNAVGRLVRGSASGLKHMQSGYVRAYAGWILFGGVLVVAWFLR